MAARDGDKEAGKYFAAYCALSPREINTHTPEQLCEECGVKPDVLWGAFQCALFKYSHAEAAVITAVNMPVVMEATVKNAKTKWGSKDREMFHKGTGFLPTPKGGGIHIDASHKMVVASTPAGVLPSQEEDMESLDSIAFLPPPGGSLPIVDAETEDGGDGGDADDE